MRKYVRNFAKIVALMIDFPKENLKISLGLVIVMQTSWL